MQKKLSLIIDKEITAKAKKHAKKEGKSLSFIIETYLKILTIEEVEEVEIPNHIKKLRGSIKLPADFDYKTELSKAIYKKYSK